MIKIKPPKKMGIEEETQEQMEQKRISPVRMKSIATPVGGRQST